MSESEKKGWFQRFRHKGDKAAPEAQAESQPAENPEPPQDEQSAAVTAPTVAPEPAVDATPAPQPLAEAPLVPEPAPPVSSTPVAKPSAAPEPATGSAAAPTPEVEDQGGWFKRLKKGLKKSTGAVSDGISGIFTKRKLDDEMLEELEELLITADLGVNVASRVCGVLAKESFNKEISDQEVKDILAWEVEAILGRVAKPLEVNSSNRPHVILMAGVNGAGKTTTIGKLGKKFKDEGKRVMLAAGDTFRAAAVEQLQIWGDRVGVPVITKEIGSDAAALAYEAMERAIAEDVDVLLIDTAGRLQNRDELMAELAKVVRVIGKKMDGAPHDTVIVLDATTGQNAVHQVEVFQKLANISGIVMTKLDGSARGGVLVACADKFGLPVHAIGIGEAIEDLQPFDPREFARALVGLET